MSGVALVELLLVIALIGLAVFIYVPYLRSFQRANDLNIAVEVVKQSIARAQARALAGEGDSDWGVKIEEKKVTVFRGSGFSGHNPKDDEVYRLPGLAVSGQSEMVFEKLSGRLLAGPGQSAAGFGLGEENLTVNSYGVIE